MWCVAELNEEYVRKLEDVLELYERPYNQAEPVVCLDEKPVTLHKDVRSPKPSAPGQVAKRDSEYERCGTANVFCAVEPKAGQHYTRPTPDRCAAEFAQIMAELALNYPTVQTIHLVVDNLNIHCRKSLTDHYGEIPGTNLWSRFTVHYTPKHGSWLNQAEILIHAFKHYYLKRASWKSQEEFKMHVMASWPEYNHRYTHPFEWTWTNYKMRQWFAKHGAI